MKNKINYWMIASLVLMLLIVAQFYVFYKQEMEERNKEPPVMIELPELGMMEKEQFSAMMSLYENQSRFVIYRVEDGKALYLTKRKI